jgi:hypothetical protein
MLIKGENMSKEVFDIVRSMDLKKVETQLALQCAPIITGLKISNLLIIQNENFAIVKDIFDNTKIKYLVLLITENKTTLLLYKEDKLDLFLSEKRVRKLMNRIGYSKCNLKYMLTLFQRRYECYWKKGGEFPHEMGLFLGYPIEDVFGFIKNRGKNFLYAGYWKVYDNLQDKVKLFEKYEQAKIALIQLLSHGISIKDAIGMYSDNMLRQVAV